MTGGENVITGHTDAGRRWAPCPADLREVSSAELLTAWEDHVRVLVFAATGVGEPPSGGRLCSRALDALATGQALVERITNTRWPNVVDALTHGATAEQVATATGLQLDELTVGLRVWADGQLSQRSLTRVQYDALVGLLDGVQP